MVSNLWKKSSRLGNIHVLCNHKQGEGGSAKCLCFLTYGGRGVKSLAYIIIFWIYLSIFFKVPLSTFVNHVFFFKLWYQLKFSIQWKFYSHEPIFHKLTDRNMQARIYLKAVLKFWGLDNLVLKKVISANLNSLWQKRY